MKNKVNETKSAIYSRRTDPSYLVESLPHTEVQPNDCAVTDAQIMSGRIAPSFAGTFDKSIHDGLNPLCRRGIDHTDVGNIMASIDAKEGRVKDKIAARRAEIEKETTDTAE